jgi:hypothetical protein
MLFIFKHSPGCLECCVFIALPAKKQQTIVINFTTPSGVFLILFLLYLVTSLD